MANFEKYEDEILAIVNQGKSIALGEDNKIYACDELGCDKCIFLKGLNRFVSCNSARIKWLYEEAAPTLTKTERAFCEIVEFGYIARDKDRGLFVYREKPIKRDRSWDSEHYKHIRNACFPFIQWEDNKPWSIEDLLKLEVEDD